jgi:hypothetical protein
MSDTIVQMQLALILTMFFLFFLKNDLILVLGVRSRTREQGQQCENRRRWIESWSGARPSRYLWFHSIVIFWSRVEAIQYRYVRLFACNKKLKHQQLSTEVSALPQPTPPLHLERNKS